MFVPAEAQTLVSVIGDSNVVGKGVSPSQGYPAKLEAALKAKGHNVRVVGSGVNGDTTDGLLSRLNSAVPNNAKVVVIWIGINDVRSGKPHFEVQAKISTIASMVQKRGIEVVAIPVGAHNDIHNNTVYTIVGDSRRHLNPAGYEQIVSRTLAAVEAAVLRASSNSKR
jgi:acyl-CoA thioesterase-1